MDVFIPLAYMTVTLFAQDLKNTSSLIFHLLPSHADYCIRSYTKWNRNMLLCDSPFLSGFPLYFRFIVAWCEEFRISIPAFPFLAKLMTPANSILSFCCLQFWFGFWTLWEFIEQNSFKLSFFFSKWDKYLNWGQTSTYYDRIFPSSSWHREWIHTVEEWCETVYPHSVHWDKANAQLEAQHRTPLPSSIVPLGPKPDGNLVGEPLALAFPQPPQV